MNRDVILPRFKFSPVLLILSLAITPYSVLMYSNKLYTLQIYPIGRLHFLEAIAKISNSIALLRSNKVIVCGTPK